MPYCSACEKHVKRANSLGKSLWLVPLLSLLCVWLVDPQRYDNLFGYAGLLPFIVYALLMVIVVRARTEACTAVGNAVVFRFRGNKQVLTFSNRRYAQEFVSAQRPGVVRL